MEKPKNYYQNLLQKELVQPLQKKLTNLTLCCDTNAHEILKLKRWNWILSLLLLGNFIITALIIGGK